MKVAVYARVSTENQDEKNQLPEIQALIQARGLVQVASYNEKASAWKNGHQKELARLIKDAQAHKFDGLVVWSLDRLTREGPERMLTMFRRFEEMGVTVISCKESWTDTPSDFRPVVLSIVAWVAEQFSKRHSDRTKAGIARKKANGGKVGRPKGAKDRRRRPTDGYRLRQARETIKRAEIKQ